VGRVLTDAEYVIICKAQRDIAESWKRGVALFTATGLDIPALMQKVVEARWRFANGIRIEGHTVLGLAAPNYRLAINRFYYAMYHSMRAVVYHHHGGDDHEKYSVLPTKVPPGFVDSAIWQNNIKSAREFRNNADYDPYPEADASFAGGAIILRDQADALLQLTRVYLIGQGCINL